MLEGAEERGWRVVLCSPKKGGEGLHSHMISLKLSLKQESLVMLEQTH